MIYARRLSLVNQAVFRLDFSDQLQSRAPEFMHGATLCGAQGRIAFQKMEYSAQDTYGRAKWSLVHGMFTKSWKFIQGVFEVYGGNLWKATGFGLSMLFYGFGRGVWPPKESTPKSRAGLLRHAESLSIDLTHP